MANEYDFIIDNMTFSYSSLTTFTTCPYCFKLTYIDREDRAQNFFGEYGLLVHDCIEQYFTGKLEAFELSDYFLDNYYITVQTPPPPFPAGMEDNYRNQGLEFFDSFSFEMSKYDIVGIEDTVDFEIDDIRFTGRPDLILKEKKTNKNVLFDYKSSIVYRTNKYTGKETVDYDKLDGYHKQMYLYSYGLRKAKNLKIDKITIWFTRPSRMETIIWKKEKEIETIDWVRSIISQIKEEEVFNANNSNSYFCNFLCGVREICPFRP